jgi:hypothetical protein
VKVVLFLLAVLVGMFNEVIGGWGEPAALAAAALFIPVFLLRKLWKQRRFWITVSALAVIQVPVVIAVRPISERARSVYMLEFVIVDMMFVGIVILLVCSKSNGVRRFR